MCCLVTILVFLGPRFAIIGWYFMDPARISAAMGGFLLSCLGFLFLPWTMLAYLVAWTPELGVTRFGWAIVLLGFIIDIGSYSGGGYGNRDKVRGYR